jgi:hypothetical protein
MNPKTSFSSLLGASLIAIVACGCAPTLHLAVEHRDGLGNLVERLQTKPGESDMQVHNWSASHTLDAIADAEFSEGLQSMSITVSGDCFDITGNPRSTQPFGYGLPVTGNAIPAGQNPTKFTFTQRLAPTCNKAGLEFRVNATATGLPSKNAGAGTVTTGDIVLKRP